MQASLAFLTLLVCSNGLKVDDSLNERPIAKVVRLLEDMQAQLQKEAEEDEEAYEAMVCWCQTNDKEKTKAIAMADQRIAGLGSAIEEYAASAQQLKTDLETLGEQVGEQSESLAKATEVRDKELAEFVAEEKDMIQTITSLKGAVITLGKAHGEFSQESLLQVRAVLQKHASKHRHLLARNGLVLNLLQQQSHTKAQTPASGEIFGMLKQMKESFETNLDNSRKEETTGITEFGELKSAKTKEIAAANQQIDTKKVELADAMEKGAQSEQDLKDTTKQMNGDQDFLADMRPKCASADSEYEARVKVRTEEIQAVSETMGILTSDEANDSFTKSMGFMQVRSSQKRARSTRAKASVLLKEAAKKWRSPKLMTLAVSMQLDAFGKVKENIDNMVAALKVEQADEVKDRDFCIKEINANERETAKYTDKKGDLEQQIADLTTSLSELGDSIAQLNQDVTDGQVGIKQASEVRQKENADFEVIVQDQRATQAILKKALDRLQEFYAKKAAFLEENDSQPEQKTIAPNAGGGGVVAMIQGIVNESKELEGAALSDEQDSQAAYEGFVKDSNKAITTATESIANKSSAKAKADIAKVQATGDLKSTIDELLALGEMSAQIHGDCDFLLKNFEERQSSRTEEMDALNQAKAIFSQAR